MKWSISIYLIVGILVLHVISTCANKGVLEKPDIIYRNEWKAKSPKNPPSPLQVLPPSEVIISHTVKEPCKTKDECIRSVQNIQAFHMHTFGWDDIGYNFLIGRDGNIYEGRGWNVIGAHTLKRNIKSIGISFIGNYVNDEPTEAQLLAVKKLIEYGVHSGKISQDYKLLGHRQCANTESPGEKLYNIIVTWDHWFPHCA